MNSSSSFKVYNASAGSGKTYTLVKEYLKILLLSTTHDSYKNILAITFTNKAMAEMKGRVIENLYGLSRENSASKFKLLREQLAIETELEKPVITCKSKQILKSILHNYAAFDISTIDRFTHKIIRTFAKDLGIPVNFEVEMNTDLILKEAVDRLIQRAGSDQTLTKVLISYTLSKTDDDKSWDISRDLFSFSKLLIHEDHIKYLQLLKNKSLADFKNFGKKLRIGIKEIDHSLLEIAESFLTITTEEGLDETNFSGKYCYVYFQKLKDKNSVDFNKTWQEKINSAPLYKKTEKPDIKTRMDTRQAEIAVLFQESKEIYIKRDQLKEILKNLIPLSLLSEISHELDTIKKERSLILISDFNPVISREIKNQPTPFIYERLGERYSNYFIDEFQDTSEMQWTNLIPLIENPLNSENPLSTGGVTLVGDAKQSIYRFRGGKAEQFIELCLGKTPFHIEPEIFELPDNYRSAPEIVNFNNAFFNYVSTTFSNEVYQQLFENANQFVKSGHKGRVEISFLEALNVEEQLEVFPEKIYEIIKELELEGFAKNDICILTRKRKQVSAVAGYLNERGISIISSESLLLDNSDKVRFINSLFTLSLRPSDKNVLLEILQFLGDYLSVNQKHLFKKQALENSAEDFFASLQAYQIYFSIKELESYSPYEGAEYIIRSFNLIKDSDAYIQFYLDFIFEFSTRNETGVDLLLELFEQKKDKLSVIAPDAKDAVKIMTIHKSKGLEFPVVIYPFANDKLRDTSKDKVWLSLPIDFNDIPIGYFNATSKIKNWGTEEEEILNLLADQNEFDAINVLYVAFTRPSKRLYILSTLDKKPKSGTVNFLLQEFLNAKNAEEINGSYVFGEKKFISEEDNNELETHIPHHFYSTPTAGNKVSIVTSKGSLWGSDQEVAINKGLLVHDILAEIDTEKDIAGALKSYSKLHQLSEVDNQILKTQLLKITQHPVLQKFYSNEYNIIRERDIIHPNGKSFRPDRLNFKKNSVSIIDYKTGAVQEYHKKQMNEYENILENMGFEVINKILIYINEGEVNPVFV